MAVFKWSCVILILDPSGTQASNPTVFHFTHSTGREKNEFLIQDYQLFKTWLTFALTSLLAVLILASQKAPLYLALTSVPTVK